MLHLSFVWLKPANPRKTQAPRQRLCAGHRRPGDALPGGIQLYRHYATNPCHTPRRRHPASGYVQGINDLVTPFLAVFLGEHFTREQPMAHWDIASIAEETMLEVCTFKDQAPDP
jgi:hypothetical protein